jgi:hypothetical protein
VIGRVLVQKRDRIKTIIIVLLGVLVLSGSLLHVRATDATPQNAPAYGKTNMLAQMDAFPSSLRESRHYFAIGVIHSPLRPSFASYSLFTLQAKSALHRESGSAILACDHRQRQCEIDSHLLDATNLVKANLVSLC